ncbi:MAG TPA: hypothetical protein VGM38_00990 [Pseudolysinimonas sp.]
MSVLPTASRGRRIAYAAALLTLAALALTGCHSNPLSPLGSSSTPGSASATPSPTPTVVLPADTMVALTAQVTADNGATATVGVIVHKPVASTDATVAAMVTRMTTVCDGEVDAGVLASQKAMMVKIDYSSTLASGTWPTDLPLALNPGAGYAELVAAGDPGVVQKEILGANPSPGDYIPHCAQTAFLTVGQSGSVFAAEYIDPSAGAGLDNSTFWSQIQYGFITPYDLFPHQRVTFAHCTDTLTALGQSLMGPSGFNVVTGPDDNPALGDSCLVGGLTGY